jgi:hypothetical protein
MRRHWSQHAPTDAKPCAKTALGEASSPVGQKCTRARGCPAPDTVLGVNGVPGLLRARLLRAAVLVAAGVVIYLALRGPGDAPGKIADAVGSACARDDGDFAVDDPYRNPELFKRHYGPRFNAVVNTHAVRVVAASCELVGGAIYFKFDSPRELDKAVDAHPPYPPLCVLSSTEMFDDDYVHEAGEQLAAICDDLDGEIVTGQGPSGRRLRKQARRQ